MVADETDDTVRVHADTLAEMIGRTPEWIRQAAHGDWLVYPPEYADKPRDTRDGYPVGEWMDDSDRYGRARFFDVPRSEWDEIVKLNELRSE